MKKVKFIPSPILPRKIRNEFNFDPEIDIKGEINSMPSQTVPDQTMPLQELIARFTRGQEVRLREPVFSDSAEDDTFILPDLEKMDFFERKELVETLKQDIQQERANITMRQLDRNAAKAKKARQDAKQLSFDAQKDTKPDLPDKK